MHGAGIGGLQADQAACAVTEGALLGLYRFDKYQKPDDNGQKNIRTLTLLERDSAKIAAMREGYVAAGSWPRLSASPEIW